MKFPLSLTLLAIGVAGDEAVAQQPATYAFVNVNVIPMDQERVLFRPTVLVRGDRIVAIGAAREVSVPAGAVTIDGTGKYLIPGLAEMHAHIPPGAQVADSTIERVLALFALTGVTTVRGMLGDPRHLGFRERAARNQILSPTIYTTGGPSFSGQSVPTVEAAMKMVSDQKGAGYDLLKIHPGIRREVFESLAVVAKREGIRFAGHVPLDLGVDRAIELGYWTVDHLDGMVEGLVPHQGPFTSEEAGFFGIRLVNRVDDSRIADLAGRLKAANVAVVPTETLMQHVFSEVPTAQMAAWPEMKYMPKSVVDGWVRTTEGWRADTAVTPAMRTRYRALRRALIKGLHQAGVTFLLGSDAPQVWNVPGFSVRRELALLVDAGLSPYQALESGTRNVAEHFGTLDRTGTVEVGKQADLILLDQNPLADITAVGRQAGVMVRGRWLPRDEIARRLAAMGAR
jgi:hypothetical protein